MAFRANQFGVSEPVIQRQGTNQIVVELPGIKNQEQAIETIGKTALLVFKGPHGHVLVTGRDLVSSQVGFGPGGSSTHVVNLTFNSTGAKLFAQATSRLVGQTIYTYLDNTLINAARVDEPITNGNAQISGIGSLSAAQHLANLLNSGALPVPMKIIEVKRVSATLGARSVKKSEVALGGAMALIALFMIVFYRFAGFLADLALAIYTLLVLAILIAIHAVLTLPGVAGIILSAGIAVDANVIIFARIKDEIRAGRTLGAAIDYGFKNALRAIMDSNASTILAGLVLYWLGSGDVRGFAVTLIIGVVVSFITAVYATRYLLRLVEDTVVVRNLRLFLGGRGVV